MMLAKGTHLRLYAKSTSFVLSFLFIHSFIISNIMNDKLLYVCMYVCKHVCTCNNLCLFFAVDGTNLRRTYHNEHGKMN